MEKSKEIQKLFFTLSKENQLKILADLRLIKNITPTTSNDVNKCPYCKSLKISKFGKYNHIQRYKCKECSKTYSESTGKSTTNLKKKQTFHRCKEIILKESYMPIRDMAKKLGVSVSTAFIWKHKILISLAKSNANYDKIVIDSSWFTTLRKAGKD